MGYEISWYVDGQVLYARYWGEQTEEEVIAAIKETREMINASSYENVHRIADVTNLVTPLPLIQTLQIVRDQNLPHIPGWSLTVGERNPVIKFIIAGVRLIGSQQMRSLKTLDDALEFLKQADLSIQWDEASV